MGKLKSSYKPLIVAVFLAVAAITIGQHVETSTNTVEVRGILGDPSAAPTLVGVAQGAEITDSAVLTQGASVEMGNSSGNINGSVPDGIVANNNAAIQDPGQPIGIVLNPSQEITYTVKNGDTLSGIAEHFKVSTASIISANPNVSKKTLRVGSSLVIPGANVDPTANTANTLPNFNGNFVMPAQGYNYGILHNYNAVDIANSCGTPVVASADGIIVPDPNIPDALDGWNGGYGNFILIKHAFGNDILTRYAHLEQMLVQIGDFVKQGQEIGLMGETGDATGCHVHFEVIGAQNPFAK